MGVAENGGTPKSSILIGISIINHPFWGTPIFGNTHIIAEATSNLKSQRECQTCQGRRLARQLAALFPQRCIRFFSNNQFFPLQKQQRHHYHHNHHHRHRHYHHHHHNHHHNHTNNHLHDPHHFLLPSLGIIVSWRRPDFEGRRTFVRAATVCVCFVAGI